MGPPCEVDFSSGRGQLEGNAAADAFGGAGHQADVSGQIGRHPSYKKSNTSFNYSSQLDKYDALLMFQQLF